MNKPVSKLLLLLVLAAAGVVSFKLFEPVFTYRLGWSSLPEPTNWTAETLDPALASQSAAAENSLKSGQKKISAPAISAALGIGGKLVWRAASGLADVDRSVNADFSTRFRIGSTSKAVTAVGVGVLIDRGRLRLDQPIGGFPHALTLGQVMSHRAGIRNYGLCLCFPVWEHQNRRHFPSIQNEVAVVRDSPLLFQPGTGFAYTSLGFNLAGAAIEEASRQTYGAYMDSAVFKPLGMTRTSLHEADTAGFYETESGRYKTAFPVDNSIRWPSGGIVSTPSDMVAFGNAMLDDRLLTAPTRNMLVSVPTGGRTDSGKIYAHGWRHSGWALFDGKLKLDSYHHNGTAVGSTSVFVVLPEKQMVLSVMMNKGDENVRDISAVADQILQAFIALP
ncbi:MAG: beta-lactamase family protein [Acidobacteria bacterium]|nr:beta-lactamase family protein [Acidobacteriota bacterium]